MFGPTFTPILSRFWLFTAPLLDSEKKKPKVTITSKSRQKLYLIEKGKVCFTQSTFVQGALRNRRGITIFSEVI